MLPLTAAALLSHLATTTCAPQGALATLEETERSVILEVGDGAAVLLMRNTVRLEPGQAGSWEAYQSVPGGTAVGARLFIDGRTITAKLEDDAAASQRFGDFAQALSHGVPAEEAKAGRERTAILADLSDGCCSTDADQVHVQVATSCGTGTMVIETTWVVESEPFDGAWRFRVRRSQERDVPLTVRGAAVRRVFVDGSRARLHGGGSHVQTIAAGEDDAVVDVVPVGADTLRGRASMERLDPAGRMSPAPHGEWGKVDGADVLAPIDPVDTLRVEVDVPRPLADPAPALRVVFVLDASKSAGIAGIARARAAMEGVLEALPDDARYAVVAFARAPWLLVDPWTSPRDRFFPEVVPQNGSDVIAALALAGRLTRDVAPEETPRVVLVSDLVQRRAVTEATWSAAFDGDAPLTHVVALPADVPDIEAGAEPGASALPWARIEPDQQPRAEAVEGTGGIYVELGAGDEPELALWPHLVAPTRIDNVSVEVAGRDPLEGAIAFHGEVPTILYAGQGVRVQSVLPAGARGAAHLTGFLWARPLALPLEASAETRRLSLARTAWGPVAEDLDDELVRAAAVQVGAVSRVTSLVHVPSYRPQEPDGVGFGISGCGCGCCGCCGGFGRSGRVISCGFGSASEIVGELAALQTRLTAAADACHVPRAAVRVEMEDKEILDVVALQGGACVVERVWQWDLLQIAEYEGLEVARVFERRLELEVRADATPPEPSDVDAEQDAEAGAEAGAEADPGAATSDVDDANG